MGKLRSEFDIRHILSDDPDYHLALRMALDVGSPISRVSKPFVADLLAAADRPGCSLDLVFGAYEQGKLISACAALECPGAAAIVYVANPDKNEVKARATRASLESLRASAWGRSIRLLEILVDADGADHRNVLERAGFHYLTRLLYLRRRGDRPAFAANERSDLTWVPYTPEAVPLFCQALEASYVQSLDCPELTGLRPTTDVLMGHRASGVFDPSLWWVVTQGESPVGVLLLNRLPSRAALEIVYLGVAQLVRGTGVANALLGRAVGATRQIGVKLLTLAVDERNTPARRMYRRWFFEQTAVRDAWIASPSQI